MIDFKPYFEQISLEEKKVIYQKAKELANVMFDRQGEFKTNINLEQQMKNRVFKIYLGAISEKLFSLYLDDLNIHYEIDGLTSEGPDKYDLKINNKTIDIKSSVEHKPFQGDYTLFALNNRNFTLPVDQHCKDIIVQIMYRFEDDKLKEVYCFGGIERAELMKEENIRNLKLNNNNYQKTYMKKLSFGKDVIDLCFNSQNSLNIDFSKNPFNFTNQAYSENYASTNNHSSNLSNKIKN